VAHRRGAVAFSIYLGTIEASAGVRGGNTGNSITKAVEHKEAGTVALDVKQEVNDVGQNERPPITRTFSKTSIPYSTGSRC
jgi:hypothetical protein